METTLTNEEYYKYFNQMILEGIVQGLNHPIEQLCSFGRHIATPYTEINKRTLALQRMEFEIYQATFMCDPSKEDINKWINDYYNKD